MDRIRLEYEIKKAGYNIADICKILGLSRSALYRKMRGISEFTQSEIATLIKVLELEDPMEIFFKNLVS